LAEIPRGFLCSLAQKFENSLPFPCGWLNFKIFFFFFSSRLLNLWVNDMFPVPFAFDFRFFWWVSDLFFILFALLGLNQSWRMGHLLLVPCSGDGDDVVVAVAEGREKRKRGKEEGMTYVILG
jgi:hypothetical protein